MKKVIRTAELRRLNTKASLKFYRSIPINVMDELDPIATHVCFYHQELENNCIRTRWSLKREHKKKRYYGEVDISPEDFARLKDGRQKVEER